MRNKRGYPGPPHIRGRTAPGKRPLLEFDTRLGEASGAAPAVPLLEAAICHDSIATFAEAGVSGTES